MSGGMSKLSPEILCAGDVIGQLCGHFGPQVYTDLQDILTNGITASMERDSDMTTEEGDSPSDSDGRVRWGKGG